MNKHLALFRIYQILYKYSDSEHLLMQQDIIDLLYKDYGIELERKAVSRNIELLLDSDVDIVNVPKKGYYLASRELNESELRMLIDSVLSSRNISSESAKILIKKLCCLSNKYFTSHVKHIRCIDDWDRTVNESFFPNIKLVDMSFNKGKRIEYSYNKYDTNLKLHTTSTQEVSPIQMLVHNQRYYLMAYDERHRSVVYHRLDKMSDMKLLDTKSTPVREIGRSFECGLNYKFLSNGLPYMFADTPERVTFLADKIIIDQIVDWFGRKNITVSEEDDTRIRISLKAVSPKAMEYWALQYLNHVEVISPESLRLQIKNDIEKAVKKYK